MTILYALVARESVVLAEFSATKTNNSAVAKQILDKAPGTTDAHASYSHDRYIFHVKRADGISVLCMAEDNAGRRIPFAFLEDVHKLFVTTYARSILTAPAYAMNDEFSRVLSQRMEYYSNDPSADSINRIRGEISQVQTLMMNNIDKVLDRGDKLDLLVDKTSTMHKNIVHFRRHAHRFRATVWWRNVRLMFAVIVVIMVIIYIVLAFLCNGPFLPSCI